MYTVVGCGACSALWIVEGTPETTGCPRCGTRHRFGALRPLVEAEDEAAARAARTALLAERSGEGDAGPIPGEADLPDDLGAVGVSDEEYLAGAGIDPEEVAAAGERARRGTSPGSGSRVDVVRAALRELDAPTAAAVVDYAAEHEVPEDAARAVLDRLVDAGVATETGGRYRPL